MRRFSLLLIALFSLTAWPVNVSAHSEADLNIAGYINPYASSGIHIAQQVGTNDPLFNQETDLSQTHVTDAWGLTTGSPVTIAVLDTGVDLTQEDLQNRLWTNIGEIPGNGIDDDHNGFIDDIHGYNVMDHTTNIADANGHGTGISSIIAATANNNKGLAGINWSAKIMVVRALDSAGGGSFENVVAGIHYAVDNGARIINMSFGSNEDVPALHDAINYAISKDVLVVAAVGNSGANSIFYPAAYSGVLAVGSVGSTNHISSFSNYGTGVDLVAPGEAVPIADLGSNKYSSGYGTSFSTAIVTGIASLILGRLPSMSAQDLGQTLIKTADTIDGNSSSIFFGAGLVDAMKALSYQPVVATALATSSKTSARANGVDTITISAAASLNGQSATGIHIHATISGRNNIVNGTQVISGSQSVDLGTTDATGHLSFALASTLAESKTITFSGDTGVQLSAQTTVTFTPVAGTLYQASWVSQSPYPSLGIGQSQTVNLTLKNTGQVAWLGAGADINNGEIKLGTDRTRDRSTTFYDSATWFSANRAATLTQAVVLPGQTGTFSFVLKASSPGQYREYFRPVVEGVAWLNDLGIYWDITVGGTTNPAPPQTGADTNPADYAAALVTTPQTVTLSPGQSTFVSIGFQNVGSATWQAATSSDSLGAVKLGTADPQDRASLFHSFSWLSTNRVIGSGVAVAPQVTTTLGFTITAPTKTGTYTEDFRLVAEHLTWFGPVARITIKVQ